MVGSAGVAPVNYVMEVMPCHMALAAHLGSFHLALFASSSVELVGGGGRLSSHLVWLRITKTLVKKHATKKKKMKRTSRRFGCEQRADMGLSGP